MKFVRITVNPNQMGGVPCIRGKRQGVRKRQGVKSFIMTNIPSGFAYLLKYNQAR